MKLLSGLLLISCSLLMFGCKKNIKPEYPYEYRCERFAGVYSMYDPINDEEYVMICDCVPKERDIYHDTLIFWNYANLIDLSRSLENYPEPNHIGTDIIKPVVDQNGNRWIFTNGVGDILERTIEKICLLVIPCISCFP